MSDPETESGLLATPLLALHQELGGRLVGFAGYRLPVQYPAGILAEHLHCRAQAALFDVSHMGQVTLHGAPDDVAAALERLVPADLRGLAPWRQRYTQFLNEAGGVLDDLMVARLPTTIRLVVNASRVELDLAHLATHLPADIRIEHHRDRALLALQGPAAELVLASHIPGCAALPFQGVGSFPSSHGDLWITRTGYTGEDGFEISVPAATAEAFARALLASKLVHPAGLGARDSLRLEAGLCLYGQDLDELTSPIEAGLAWSIGKRRRVAGDFPGAAALADQLAHGPHRMRVAILPEGRAPVRAGTLILAEDGTGAGTITSGGFGPSLNAPVAMGYVRRDLAAPGTPLLLERRGQRLPARVAALPVIPHRFKR